MFLVLWCLAVAPGILSTRGLEWPYDVDGFRDVSNAQHFRDSWSLGDPFYKNEAAWYSPLVPAALALFSDGQNIPTPRAFVLLGAWLNALAPLSFWLLARSLVGRWPSSFAALAFLFLPGRAPAWASATYSPWLFPSVTAQIPLYCGLRALMVALETNGVVRHLTVGLLLGTTFLAHTATGMLFAVTILSTTVWRLFETSRPLGWRRHVILMVASFLIAGLLVGPFLYPIAAQYGFHVLNRAPATWADESLQLPSLLAGLLRPASIIQLLLAAWGGRWVCKTRDRRTCVVLGVWGSVAASGFLYGLLAERWDWLPGLVPAFHFYFLLRAWKWILFGAGMAILVEALLQAVTSQLHRPVVGFKARAAIVTILAICAYPRYLGREAYTTAPARSRQMVQFDERGAYEWILNHVSVSAVFLATDADALRVIGPAGRFVVSVNPYFSNPYVDYAARAAARDKMLAHLMQGELELFKSIASEFGVTHVLARSEPATVLRARSGSILREIFSSGTIVIFEMTSQPAEI